MFKTVAIVVVALIAVPIAAVLAANGEGAVHEWEGNSNVGKARLG